MINLEQFRQFIILPTLSTLQAYSSDAEELLVFTAATESLGGYYLHQVKGPAVGVYQMEPATYTDIWENFIKHRSSLMTMLALNFDANRIPSPDRMIYDLKFATVMARIHYMRNHEDLPKKDDVDGLWEYYKKYYNTPKGKATKEKAIANYEKWLKG